MTTFLCQSASSTRTLSNLVQNKHDLVIFIKLESEFLNSEIFHIPGPDSLAYGVIRFTRHKTKIGIELEMNEDLADLWKWFVEFKRKEAIVSEFLLVYPRYFDMRSRARQVKHRTMQEAWRDACKKAG